MISKERIHKTLICYWSAEDESFVAESSLIPHVVLGVGNTREEALMNFGDMLDDAYDEIASDNVAGYKAGRPAKGYVPFNANIRPTSKSKISDLAHEMEISQGEVLDYLAFFYECKLQECDHVPTKDELVVALNAILREQVSLSERMKQLALVSQLPAALSVGIPGLYLVEFNSITPQVSETTHGIGHALLLPDQTIQGGDGGYVYNGKYRIDGTTIKVRLTVTKTNPYVPSIFENIDRFELDVAGVIEGGVATLEGVRPDRPDDKVRIRLTRQTVTPDF